MFTPLEGDKFGETTAYRTTKEEFGRTVTVVVTDNPELYKSQIRGVENNVNKCLKEFEELSGKLKERENGKKVRGRQYTLESVEAKVKSILTAEHMKKIFDYDIIHKNNQIIFNYKLNDDKFIYIKEHILGRSVLFTDRDDWSNEQIVGSYRAQYHVEECFKQMKHTEFLSFVPIRHYTDKHIIVHAFYCVLALTLSTVLNLELKRMGHDVSISKMFHELSEITQVVNTYKIKKKTIKIASFSDINTFYKYYFDKYKLFNYAYKERSISS
jgi:transposase